MHRYIGTVLVCCAIVFTLGSSPAFAYESPQQYGIEVRGGFGQYDMGDVTTGIESMQHMLANNSISSTLSKSNQGPAGGFSLLYRPSKHTLWEVGFNALTNISNKVDAQPDSFSGEILMHANEFFVKGDVVATLTNRLHLDFGGGIAYYVSELQIQDNYTRRYNYDADGRAFGLIGTVGLEFLATKHLGIILQGGGRLANTANFSYESTPGVRSGVSVLNGTRPIEVNLSGAYGTAGLRVYFDKVTKPVDFTR
jgi:hypothetical protein